MARSVDVLGPGCRRCSELFVLVSEVARAECPDVVVRHVTDPAEIVGRGLFMNTPALVVDGIVVAAGRIPSRREVSGWLGATASTTEVRS